MVSRALRVITRLNIGGPARQALLLSKELPGWDTTLVAGDPSPGEGELSDPDVAVRRISLRRSLNPYLDVKAFREVRSLIATGHFDVLHTHMAKAGAIGRMAASPHPLTRTVHTYHGHVLDGYFPKPVEQVFVEAERYLARRTDALIAVSSEIRDQLLELGIGKARQWHVIPLGFDLSRFLEVKGPSGKLRSELGIPEHVPVIGVLGRLAPIKGHQSLLESMIRIPDAHLAVFGDGELRSELELLAYEIGIAERVHFMGWWDDVAGALSDIDVVALSSHNEGTPVSLIEALAAGRPVVATRVGGVPSVVDDGINGLLVPPSDPQALGAALIDLLQDAPRRYAMGRRGREKAALRWDKGRLINEIASLYEDLMTPKTGVPQLRDKDAEVARTLDSFGYEWTRFDKIQREDELFWKRYFTDVPVESLKGKVVLDAGCGKGRFSYFTAPHVERLVALDGSDAVLAAKRNLEAFPNSHVVRGDLRRIPLKKGHFDFVFCLGVLHHLPDPEQGFRNLVETVSPGGGLLIYVYSRASRTGLRSVGLDAAAAIRRVTVNMPWGLLRVATVPIAAILYLSLVVPGMVGTRFKIRFLEELPLQTYRRRPFRSLWLDTFDRLSAPTEARYLWSDLEAWFDASGLTVESVREDAGWIILTRKPGDAMHGDR